MVNSLLETTGIDLSRGGGVPELMRLQEHFKEYRIVVFGGLNCEDVYFDGQVESEKRINLVYDDVNTHHVINNLTGAMARRYICKGCNKGCKRGETHKCGETCSDCKSIPPCTFAEERVPCESCKDILEVARVSKNIRRTNWKARQSAKRCEIAPCVTCA